MVSEQAIRGISSKRIVGATHGGSSCGWHPNLYSGGVYRGDARHLFDETPSHREVTTGDVLRVTVSHVLYPVTEGVLHQVFDAYGAEQVVVLERADHVKALVRFRSSRDAERARDVTHWRCVYGGCCWLDVQYMQLTPSDSVMATPATCSTLGLSHNTDVSMAATTSAAATLTTSTTSAAATTTSLVTGAREAPRDELKELALEETSKEPKETVQELCKKILATLNSMIESGREVNLDTSSKVVEPAGHCVVSLLTPPATVKLSDIIVSSPVPPVIADSVLDQDSAGHKVLEERSDMSMMVLWPPPMKMDKRQPCTLPVQVEVVRKYAELQLTPWLAFICYQGDSQSKQPWPPPPFHVGQQKRGGGLIRFKLSIHSASLLLPPWPPPTQGQLIKELLVEKVDFLKLQNGSDIRGVAVAGVEGEPVNLTEPVTEAIAAAFAAWLLNKKKADGLRRLRISVGHDSRISAHKLQNAVTHGITAGGHDVLQFGLASTPAMFNSTLTEDEIHHCPVDGAIMITASHLPYNRNGLKFFTSDGGLNKVDIKDILERASRIYEESAHGSRQELEQASIGVVTNVDYMSIYASDLVQAVRKSAGNKEKPLEGLHIVADAGNGAGGFFVDKVLRPLGAVTTGSQFLEPDGLFPNHIPNPEDKTAMKAITQAVLDNKADLGIIFDTDVDRSAAVDSSGCELNRNRLIALMSAIVLEEHPGTTIVTDSVTSDGLTLFIEEKLGGKHHRFKRGYKNVIDEAIRLNSIGEESHLAMETSGHGALKENHWLDDGAYLMVKLLNQLAAARTSNPNISSKVLTDLVEGLEEAAVTVEIRLKIDQNHADLKGGSFRDYGESVLKHLESVISKDPNLHKALKNYEGVRVSGYGGWFLLRLSLHDPVLPLNIEASSKDDAIKLGLAVLAAVSEFSALDITAMNKFLQQ